jgi:hypothetical protein
MSTSLIGSVLLIAGAEAAVYHHSNILYAWQLSYDGELMDCRRDAQLFLDCPSERRLLHNVRDLPQIKRELQAWSNKRSALRYLLGGMDDSLRDSTRIIGLELAQEQLNDETAAQYARGRLLGCPLPECADLIGALKLAQRFPLCLKLYQELEFAKLAILTVKPVLQALAENYATPACAADEIYVALVDHGVAATAALALARGERRALQDLLRQFAKNRELLASCPQMGKLLTQLGLQLVATVPLRAQVVSQQLEKVMQVQAPYEVEKVATDPLLKLVEAQMAGRKNNPGS